MVDTPATRASDDVLRQRTRARLFDRLRELKRPATTEELAASLGLHRSGVRVHLDRLEVAGLVRRDRVRRPRGRPRDAWSVSPGAQPDGQPPHAYAELAGWLAGAIPSRPERLYEVEAAGRRLGHEMASGAPDLPLEERLQAALAALGFEPRSRAQRPDSLCIELANCPYRAAVRANQPVVCALHRGLTRGLLDRLEPQAALRAFVPRDPDQAGCLIEIERATAARPAEREETS